MKHKLKPCKVCERKLEIINFRHNERTDTYCDTCFSCERAYEKIKYRAFKTGDFTLLHKFIAKQQRIEYVPHIKGDTSRFWLVSTMDEDLVESNFLVSCAFVASEKGLMDAVYSSGKYITSSVFPLRPVELAMLNTGVPIVYISDIENLNEAVCSTLLYLRKGKVLNGVNVQPMVS